MLATRDVASPKHPVIEPKWDGVRKIITPRTDGTVSIRSRNGETSPTRTRSCTGGHYRWSAGRVCLDANEAGAPHQRVRFLRGFAAWPAATREVVPGTGAGVARSVGAES